MLKYVKTKKKVWKQSHADTYICSNKTNKEMNVIIVIKQGIAQTPMLIKNNITAQAAFNNICEQLLGDDVSEFNLHSDSAIDDVNNYLKRFGIEILWFEGLTVNKYINK